MVSIPIRLRWWGWGFHRFEESAHCLVPVISVTRGKDLRAEIWSVCYIANKGGGESSIQTPQAVCVDDMATDAEN
jgi:hypothetical protein